MQKKIILFSLFLFIFCSFALPFHETTKKLFLEKRAFLYYYNPQIDLESKKNHSIYCQFYEIIEQWPNKNWYENMIATALLLPKKLELQNNNNDNVRVLSAFMHEKVLTVNLSKEFYKLDKEEESSTITAILLALNVNAPEIENVKLQVDHYNIETLNGIFNYAIPLSTKKQLEKNLPFFAIWQQKKKAKKTLLKIKNQKYFGEILNKKIIVKPC